MSKEVRKTVTFCIVAGVSLLIAGAAFWANLPPNVAGFELVGKPFFEKFTASDQPQSMDVYAVDANARLRHFAIQRVDGLWIIPSHHNYPAEAVDRLAKAAASLIAMQRDAIVGRLPADHSRFGVLDPQDDTNIDIENAGKRIVLRDGSGQVLADLIIGREVPETETRPEQKVDPTNRGQTRKSYYVRRADEQQTYRAHLNLELSTRFSDWIDTRLLDVAMGNITSASVNNYELRERVNPARQTIEVLKIPGDEFSLSRSKENWQWQLPGLDESQEMVDENRVNQWLRTLTNLKIVGVRPKFQYQGQQFLTPDLTPKRIPELVAVPELFAQAVEVLRRNLRDKGFNLIPRTANLDDFSFVAQFGEFAFSTSDGIGYHLYVGRSISGDDDVIEFGGTSEELPTDQGAEHNSDTPDVSDEATQMPGQNDAQDAKNRFLMITVHLDESQFPQPEEPQPPVEPTKPEGYTPASDPPAKVDGAQESNDAQEKSGDQEQETDSDVHQKAGGVDQDVAPPAKPERNPEFVAYDKALAEYEQAKMQFEVAKMRYETEVAERKKNIEAAQRRVDELNDRYGAWYYVVSADNLASLRLARSEVIKPRTPPANDASDELSLPMRPNIDFPIEDDQQKQAADDETAHEHNQGLTESDTNDGDDEAAIEDGC